MAHVSLILPIAPGADRLDERIHEHRQALERAGHRVEVLAVADPRLAADLVGLEGAWNLLVAESPGLAVSAIAGLRQAEGDLLLILDLECGYCPEDLARVIAPVERGEADLAVGCQGKLGFLGRSARALIGTSDPRSGLVALSRSCVEQADEDLAPVGSRYAIELLLKTQKRSVDVPVRDGAPASRRRRNVSLDDLRHFKRLADHRFGNASRLLQFCMVGASGMMVDLSTYALFQWLFSKTWLARVPAPIGNESLALAASGALAIALALTWNFSLNRRLTFNYARHGSIVRQFLTYALSNALGIALSFSLRIVLPGRFAFFHRHKLAAALVGIVAATGISFSLSRWVVFRRRPVLPTKTAATHTAAPRRSRVP
jgi:dolichol-phosphate mannosyltransferase